MTNKSELKSHEYQLGFVATIHDADRIPTDEEMAVYLKRAVFVDLKNEDEGQSPKDCGEDATVSIGVDFRPPLLESTDALCERGNTMLIEPSNGDLIAWLGLRGDERLEVSWCPGNWPGLNVRVVEMTDEQLAEHINKRLEGWHIRRLNIEGVNVEGDRVAYDFDEDEDSEE